MSFLGKQVKGGVHHAKLLAKPDLKNYRDFFLFRLEVKRHKMW